MDNHTDIHIMRNLSQHWKLVDTTGTKGSRTRQVDNVLSSDVMNSSTLSRPFITLRRYRSAWLIMNGHDVQVVKHLGISLVKQVLQPDLVPATDAEKFKELLTMKAPSEILRGRLLLVDLN